MDEKTGIFTFRRQIDKAHDSGRVKSMLDWARESIAYQARQTIVARLFPSRMYVIAITSLYEDEGSLDIRMEQKVLIALSDWTEAEVGDCVVGEEDFQEAFEMKNGDIWLFEPYGLFPMVGPNASSTTRLKIYRRKR